MEVKEKIKLEEFVAKLKAIRGRHTELVTVYIPAGFDKNTVTKQIEEEKGTASNIKSKSTRKNVVDALESIGRELKLYKQTPKNGLAIFAGNTSETESQEKIEVFVIEPPQSLNIRMYRCDKEFVLEPLEAMLEVEEVYGLVVMDRREATLGLLEGKQIKVLRKLTSGVPGKTEKGGQSAARFARIRENAAKEFYRRIADHMKEIYFNMPKLKGIILGGPVPTKEDFMKEGQLITKLKEMVIGLKDIGNTDESGLTDLVEVSHDLLANQEIVHEKKLLDNFFEMLGKGKKTAYKKKDVEKAMKYGAVDILILSKKLDKQEAKELIEKAEAISAKVEIVSDETEEGQQFLNMGGIGAILRFEI